jgi:hypothetical protein
VSSDADASRGKDLAISPRSDKGTLFCGALFIVLSAAVAVGQDRSGPPGPRKTQDGDTALGARTDSPKGENRFVVTQAPYGAKGNDNSDDSAAIQNSLRDGAGQTIVIPNGIYVVSEDLLVPPDTRIEGQDILRTVIHIKRPDGFKKGIFVTTGRGAMRLTNVTIQFDQPEGTKERPVTAAELVHYKPAVYARGTSHLDLSHVAIFRAWDGIDMTGGCGHNYVDDLRMSMFHFGIDIDDARDTIRVNNLHCWPFGLGHNQRNIFSLPNQSVGIHVGRCDGLMLTNSLFINATAIMMYRSTTGTPWLLVSNCDFDTQAAVQQTAGSFMASNCGFTSSPHPTAEVTYGEPSLNVTAGAARISSSVFLGGIPDVPMVRITGAANCAIDATYFQMDVVDRPAIEQDGANSIMQVSNNFFDRKGAQAYRHPVIDIRTGATTIVANRVSANNGGGGTFLRVINENFDVISNNVAPGWSMLLPRPAGRIQSAGNLVQP